MPADVPRTRWSRGVIGVAIVSMVAALVTAFLWSGPASSGGGAWRSTPRESGAATREALLRASSKSGERAPVPESSLATSTTPTASPAATGVLRLHVFDAVSGEPVAHQECIVYSERDGNRIHAKVTTDADGCALVEQLPETTVLVCVPRSSRFANTTAGLWLSRGRTRELEIRLDACGTIVGRVVDDLGRPLADAEVSFAPTWPCGNGDSIDGSSTVRTSSDGRFEMERVQSVPRAVWIVDAAMRPERWDPVRLIVRSGDATAFAAADVNGGGRVDRGDVVIERARTFVGHVLDHRREPVANAWIGLGDYVFPKDIPIDPSRWSGSNRGRTGLDGSFHVSRADSSRRACVISPIGTVQTFELPDIGPGESAERVELVLDDRTMLEIECVDAEGSRIVAAGDRSRRSNVRFPSSRHWGGRLILSIQADDDVELRESIDPGRDGLFRIELPPTFRVARRLRLELAGYLPVADELGPPASELERRRYELRPLPVVRLHVHGPEQPEWTARERTTSGLIVHACLIEPDAYAADNSLGQLNCCGLGSSWWSKVHAFDEVVELPVLADRPFWIHARIPMVSRDADGKGHSGASYYEHFGPFAPDGTLHEIEIPKLPPPPPLEESRRPPPPLEVVPTVTMRLRVVDAKTGLGIAAAVSLEPAPRDSNYSGEVSIDGALKGFAPIAGKYQLIVRREGYASASPVPIELVEGRANDLGTMTLVPLPEVRLRVLESDGRVPPTRTLVSGSLDELAESSISGQLDEEGRLIAHAQLGSTMKLWVFERLSDPPSERRRSQLLIVETRHDTAELDVRLAPWQTVEVVVSGAIQEFPGAQLRVTLCDVVGVVRGESGLHPQVDVLQELTPFADGRRRFRVETYPGPFLLRVRSSLVRAPDTPIEVRNSNDPQRFELSSTR